MKIIVGHSNMDLDCIGSIVLARKLYPDHVPVMSSVILPVAKNLYNLYKNDLEFLPSKELGGCDVDALVIVDTRSSARIQEYLRLLRRGPSPEAIVIYDHHPDEEDDFPGVELHCRDTGANTTILGLEVMRRGIPLTPGEATIALAGIYADTGSFMHENVSPEDLRVSAFLLEQGASLALVRTFLKSLREEHQVELFHTALGCLQHDTVRGHLVGRFLIDLPAQAQGLASVVEKVFEVETPDVLFGVFGFEKEGSALVVARSQSRQIEVNRILGAFGGGGHRKAASALVRNCTAEEVAAALFDQLDRDLPPAVSASGIMTHPVETLRDRWSLLEASLHLERINHTGCPVLDDGGALVGFLALRDIMKGRKKGMMHAPVKAFMIRKVVTGAPGTTMREMERLFFENNIGHLPVIDSGALVGIITRSDYLAAIREPERELVSPGPEEVKL